MPTFEERERAFEATFAHDQEFRFLVTARRDKLFAARVADQAGLSGQARQDLTAAALAVRDGPGHDAVLLAHMTRVLADHGHGADPAALAAALADCAAQARQQLLAGPLHGTATGTGD